jgi:succinoglycan biosynthesis protein ExoM
VRSAVVAVCTYDRPVHLRSLLAALDREADHLQTTDTLRAVIIDDHPSQSARSVCAEFAVRGRVPVQYVPLGAQSISTARASALDHGVTGSDFVVCVDDDCVPETGWIRALLDTADRFDADVVLGRHEWVADPDGPTWLSNEPFLVDHETAEDGSVPTAGNMANMMLRSSWFRASGVRFHDDYGDIGGEDMVFFRDLQSAGAHIRFSTGSVVRETYAAHRATLRYQLWRQMWLGNNEAHINRHTRAATEFRLALRATRRIVNGAVGPFSRALRRQPSQWRWGLATIGRGLGLLTGIVGVRMTHRT